MLLGIDEWRREDGFEYNLQDLTVISAMDKIQRSILPLMQKIEKEDPARWLELGIQVFRLAVARIPKPTTTEPLGDLDLNMLIDDDNTIEIN